MKKYFITLLIITIICVIAIFLLLRFSPVKNTSSKSSQVLSEIKNDEEISDPEGYTYLIKTAGAVTYDLGSTIANGVFIIFIPSILLFLISVCQVISGLVQIGEEKNWKSITSKVFISISIALLLSLCLFLIFDLIGNFDVNRALIAIALFLNIACLVIHIVTIVKTSKFNKVKE